MQKVSDRIKIVREHLGKSQKDMADDLKISLPALQGYEAGKSYPGGKVFESLVKLGFNANWLLCAKGNMKLEDMPSLYPEDLTSGFITTETRYGFVNIPRYNVAASAGGGAVITSEQIVDHLSFKADWVQNALDVPVSALALINVIGDSMEPTLAQGDLILIDMSHRGVKDNAIYVLRLNGELLVKRIQRKLDGSMIVKSDNSVYEPEVVNSENVNSLNVVGRVVWCGRRM